MYCVRQQNTAVTEQFSVTAVFKRYASGDVSGVFIHTNTYDRCTKERQPVDTWGNKMLVSAKKISYFFGERSTYKAVSIILLIAKPLCSVPQQSQHRRKQSDSIGILKKSCFNSTNTRSCSIVIWLNKYFIHLCRAERPDPVGFCIQ